MARIFTSTYEPYTYQDLAVVPTQLAAMHKEYQDSYDQTLSVIDQMRARADNDPNSEWAQRFYKYMEGVEKSSQDLLNTGIVDRTNLANFMAMRRNFASGVGNAAQAFQTLDSWRKENASLNKNGRTVFSNEPTIDEIISGKAKRQSHINGEDIYNQAKDMMTANAKRILETGKIEYYNAVYDKITKQGGYSGRDIQSLIQDPELQYIVQSVVPNMQDYNQEDQQRIAMEALNGALAGAVGASSIDFRQNPRRQADYEHRLNATPTYTNSFNNTGRFNFNVNKMYSKRDQDKKVQALNAFKDNYNYDIITGNTTITDKFYNDIISYSKFYNDVQAYKVAYDKYKAGELSEKAFKQLEKKMDRSVISAFTKNRNKGLNEGVYTRISQPTGGPHESMALSGSREDVSKDEYLQNIVSSLNITSDMTKEDVEGLLTGYINGEQSNYDFADLMMTSYIDVPLGQDKSKQDIYKNNIKRLYDGKEIPIADLNQDGTAFVPTGEKIKKDDLDKMMIMGMKLSPQGDIWEVGDNNRTVWIKAPHQGSSGNQINNDWSNAIAYSEAINNEDRNSLRYYSSIFEQLSNNPEFQEFVRQSYNGQADVYSIHQMINNANTHQEVRQVVNILESLLSNINNPDIQSYISQQRRKSQALYDATNSYIEYIIQGNVGEIGDTYETTPTTFKNPNIEIQ